MKTVRFLKDDHVHRAGEEPFTYKEGSTHELRDDRANIRIQNGIAVEVNPKPKGKKNGDPMDSAKAVAEQNSSDTGERPIDESGNGGKGKGK